mgnify:CR=1 FL=1
MRPCCPSDCWHSGHEGEAAHAGVPLEDLVGDSGERAAHPGRIHEYEARQSARIVTRDVGGGQAAPGQVPSRIAATLERVSEKSGSRTSGAASARRST